MLSKSLLAGVSLLAGGNDVAKWWSIAVELVKGEKPAEGQSRLWTTDV